MSDIYSVKIKEEFDEDLIDNSKYFHKFEEQPNESYDAASIEDLRSNEEVHFQI